MKKCINCGEMNDEYYCKRCDDGGREVKRIYNKKRSAE